MVHKALLELGCTGEENIMLVILGFLIVGTFMYLVMSNRMSGFAALVVVPIIFAVFAGFAPKIGVMMMKGVITIAPVGIMMMFAIMYFGIMIDVGLFDSLIVKILKKVNGDPLKIVMGSAVLSILASLEGEGAVAYMITCTAMMPLYKRLNMNPVVLAVLGAMVASIKAFFPWAGPTARVLASLKLDASTVFYPLVPVILCGMIWMMFTAYFLGRQERARLGVIIIEESVIHKIAQDVVSLNPEFKRPKLFWVNLIMTLTLMGLLLVEKQIGVPIAVLFMVGTAIALIVNFPVLKEQQGRMVAHAKEALQVTAVVFGAGVFMGILSDTKMTESIARFFIDIIPSGLGSHMAMVTAILSGPLSFLLSNDAFYFGVLPVLNQMASAYGISAAEIGRASLMGAPIHQLSPLVAALWLLVGMCGVSFGDLQKKGLLWMSGLMTVNITVALLTGAITF
jgi:CitMHS family citrate-Mg2+:H+ or citrate-Ca2+:H+ symporter